MKKLNHKQFPTSFLFFIGLILIALFSYLVWQETSTKSSLVKGDKQQTEQLTKANCLADDCLNVQDLTYPVANLPDEVKEALDEAIVDEYKALATYEKIIEKFGQVRPFSMIKGAEEQHIASLKAIYDKYGLEFPANDWLKKVSSPNTLQQACQTGVDAEIANAALYREKLLPTVQNYEDITLVFTKLMNASQEKHLPAFERCK